MPDSFWSRDEVNSSVTSRRSSRGVARFSRRASGAAAARRRVRLPDHPQAMQDVRRFLSEMQRRPSNPLFSLAHDALFRPPFSEARFRKVFAVKASDIRRARAFARNVKKPSGILSAEASAAYRKGLDRMAMLAIIVSRDAAALRLGSQPSPPPGYGPDMAAEWVAAVSWAQGRIRRLMTH